MTTKRKKANKANELARRREYVARYALMGLTQREIADALAALDPPMVVNQSTVNRDLKALRDEWRSNAAEHIDKLKAKESERMDLVMREAFLEWKASKDGRLLNTVIQASKRKAALLGIDKPKKVDVAFDPSILKRSLREMSDEDLDALLAAGIVGGGE